MFLGPNSIGPYCQKRACPSAAPKPALPSHHPHGGAQPEKLPLQMSWDPKSRDQNGDLLLATHQETMVMVGPPAPRPRKPHKLESLRAVYVFPSLEELYPYWVLIFDPLSIQWRVCGSRRVPVELQA
ncbi:Hypothetical predicted protein [Pelobates cultripes]|uniref:Uncharacterized protein n=1 Tax=Pelobates cultripes TaxID=61616 RepID=A0AAD1WIM0_PELCU|nr:Hypothetical predicted protein [Pelobates cultripes]